MARLRSVAGALALRAFRALVRACSPATLDTVTWEAGGP